MLVGQFLGPFGVNPFACGQAFGSLVDLVGWLAGPGVIGNRLPVPTFMPHCDACRVASSTWLGRCVLGHEAFGIEAEFTLIVEVAGFEGSDGSCSAGGHIGIVSSGEPETALFAREIGGGCGIVDN